MLILHNFSGKTKGCVILQGTCLSKPLIFKRLEQPEMKFPAGQVLQNQEFF
jgi:hypothetical protein